MTLIEITLVMGLTLTILFVGLLQITVQNEVWHHNRRLEFYTRDVPRISRSIQTLCMQGQSFWVADTPGSSSGIDTGKALVIDVRGVRGSATPNSVFFQDGKLFYENSQKKRWVLAKNIIQAEFTMNDDATVTVFIDRGNGVAAEFIVERL